MHEAQRCDVVLCGRQYRHDDVHSVRLFTRLMLRGKVQEAVRLMTERTTGGVLGTEDIVEGTGKTVLEILKKNTLLTANQIPQLLLIVPHYHH